MIKFIGLIVLSGYNILVSKVKVKPLYNLLNQNPAKFGIVHEDLIINQSIVLHFRRYSCKQFIRVKPIRFFPHPWVIASATGLPYQVEIYEGGAGDQSNDRLEERVVMNVLQICSNPQMHSIFFDDFFSSYQLLCDLTVQGFRATGTMRDNRIMKCSVKEINVKKEEERGSLGYQSYGDIEIMRCNDNSVVTLEINA